MSLKVLVSIVTYNSGRHLETCLEGLNRQSYRNFDVCIFDNASSDSTADIIERHRADIRTVHVSDKNIGFCAAQNRVIDSVSSEYVLVLNPDVILDEHFLETLVKEMERNREAGAASGKLYRWSKSLSIAEMPPKTAESGVLDSAGIYFTRNQRHFDRGSGEIDTGEYSRKEYVFGVSGAAAFYRRAMLDDIRQGIEYFDEDFFAYREDADLAWRAQWMGWRCLFVPDAKGFHERQVLPQGRSRLPDAINMHSFKNRFLLRVKNMDPGTWAVNFIPTTGRDVLALGYVLLREWSSIPGFFLFVKALPKALKNRRSLKRNRRIQPSEIRKWFTGKQSEPI
ncbi:MAG: glycosyltransferase family 2 protein [Acidobacteriota bacterium]